MLQDHEDTTLRKNSMPFSRPSALGFPGSSNTETVDLRRQGQKNARLDRHVAFLSKL